jgi:pyruvate dehydrogenase E1 component beta subunit
MLYNNKGEVPEGEYLTPLGQADIKRAGNDVTIVCHGKTVGVGLKAAEQLAIEGINAEVIDLRTIQPLDTRTILESVARTNRCVVAEEGWSFAGIGAQVVDVIQREAFDSLDAPIIRVTGADVPMPYNKHLEKAAKADPAKVIAAVKRVLYI